MSNERTIPGPLALSGFAPKTDPDWNVWMDQNLLKLSVTVHLSVISRTTDLPAMPTDKDIYIVKSDDMSNPDEIAVYDVDTWKYLTPTEGMQAWVQDDEEFVYFDGTDWTVLSAGGGAGTFLGLSDTPGSFGTDGQMVVVNPGEDGLIFTDPPSGGSDGFTVSEKTANYTAVLGDANSTYLRMNVASANTLTVPANSSVAFPTGTTLQGVQAGAGVTTITPDTGVTINSRGSLTDTAGQFAAFMLTKVGTDEWDLTGDLA